ncbi:MAG TPA: hypothetical protein VK498_02160 [Ferruginibacter sp.]|nr:hypothetical protein [Ferruginibacter sp.]
MKKHVLLLLAGVMLTFASVKAQGGYQRQTPEERTKVTMEKLEALKMDETTKTKVEVIFSDYYNKQEKAFEEMRASGNKDRDAMQAKRKELSDARDLKLKEAFSAEQLKKWTEEIEPALRPQRRTQGQ